MLVSSEGIYDACQQQLLERHFLNALISGCLRELPQPLVMDSERPALLTSGRHKRQYSIVRAHIDAWLHAKGINEGETSILRQVLIDLQWTENDLVRADCDRSLWGSVAQQLYAGLPMEAELSTEARASLPKTRQLHDKMLGLLGAETRAARGKVVLYIRKCLTDVADATPSPTPGESRGGAWSVARLLRPGQATLTADVSALHTFAAQTALPQVELALQWVTCSASLPLEYWRNEKISKVQQDMHMTRAEFVTQWKRRHFFTQYFSWAVPTMKVLLLINAFTNGELLLEVGAGAGLWSSLLRCLGSNVIATDEAPPENTFTQVQKLDAAAAVLSWELQAQTLLLLWPDRTDMAFWALDAFRGPRMVYVGEPCGGCTGSERFFELLKRNWSLIGLEPIPAWWNCDDRCFFYQRTASMGAQPPSSSPVPASQGPGSAQEPPCLPCCICLEGKPAHEGIKCSCDELVCRECLDPLARPFAGKDLALLERDDGRLKCPGLRCSAAPYYYPDADVAIKIPADVFDLLIKARLQVQERKIRLEMQQMQQTQAPMQTDVDKARKHIEELLNLVCPRCAQAYVDFNGCAALECSGCGGAFLVLMCGNDVSCSRQLALRKQFHTHTV
jgi:hypothetical protein